MSQLLRWSKSSLVLIIYKRPNEHELKNEQHARGQVANTPERPSVFSETKISMLDRGPFRVNFQPVLFFFLHKFKTFYTTNANNWKLTSRIYNWIYRIFCTVCIAARKKNHLLTLWTVYYCIVSSNNLFFFAFLFNSYCELVLILYEVFFSCRNHWEKFCRVTAQKKRQVI